MGKQKQKRKRETLIHPPQCQHRDLDRSDLISWENSFCSKTPQKNNYKKKKKSHSDSSCAWTSDRIDCSQRAKTNLIARGWYVGLLVCIYMELLEKQCEESFDAPATNLTYRVPWWSVPHCFYNALKESYSLLADWRPRHGFYRKAQTTTGRYLSR